jgi:hypothetical protein
MTVHNGERINAVLPDYEGEVGYNRVRGVAQIAYRPNKQGKTKAGDVVKVGDGERTVRSVKSSDFLKGYKVATLDG